VKSCHLCSMMPTRLPNGCRIARPTPRTSCKTLRYARFRPSPPFRSIDRNPGSLAIVRKRRHDLPWRAIAKNRGLRRDMTDLDALDLRQGDEAAPNPEQELIALEDS